ncbi:MAG: FAD-dependent monooxygenase [Pseudomonadota bacterium]
MKIGIIGGGIAGLVAAIACARHGFDVTIYEAADAFGDVGAGIQLSPNATFILRNLGCDLDSLSAMRPAETVLFNRNERMLMRMPHDQSPNAPYLQVYRPDLVSMLADNASALDVKVYFQAEASGKKKDDQFVISVNEQSEAFDILVHADGVNSAARSNAEGRRGSGVAWRALVPGDTAPKKYLDGPRIFLGPRKHLVTYPLRDGASINIVALEDQSKDAKFGWSNSRDVDAFRALFSPVFPKARDLFGQVAEVKQWALVSDRRAKMDDKNGAPIIGDATLAMPPFMAQGAAMAIEDAMRLADDIAQGYKGWSDASRMFRARRKQDIMRAAIRNGSLFHFYPPVLGPIFHVGMWTTGRLCPQFLVRRYAWIYDFRHDFIAS